MAANPLDPEAEGPLSPAKPPSPRRRSSRFRGSWNVNVDDAAPKDAFAYLPKAGAGPNFRLAPKPKEGAAAPALGR